MGEDYKIGKWNFMRLMSGGNYEEDTVSSDINATPKKEKEIMFKNGIKAKVDQAHAQNLVVKKETGILDVLKKELKEIALKRDDGLLNGTDVDAIVEDNVRGSMKLLDAALLLITAVEMEKIVDMVLGGRKDVTHVELLQGVFIEIIQKLEGYVTVSVTKMADRVGKTTIEEVVDYKVTKFGKIRFKKH